MKPDSKHFFDEYIVQGETTRKQRAEHWQIAIGLQDVDQLKPSPYLLVTAKQHIEGKLDIASFFGLVIIRDALLSCGKIKLPLNVLFRGVEQVRGRLQLIDVLKTDGDLPMLRPLFPGGFALDDVFVKNVLGISFHCAAACKFISSL